MTCGKDDGDWHPTATIRTSERTECRSPAATRESSVTVSKLADITLSPGVFRSSVVMTAIGTEYGTQWSRNTTRFDGAPLTTARRDRIKKLPALTKRCCAATDVNVMLHTFP